jgi:hypothetical protein
VRHGLLPSLVLASSTLLGCPKPDGGAGGEACDADLEQIRAEILVPQCTGEFCHDADAPAANLDFTRSAEAIAAQLVDVPSGVCADWVRVVPGDPERSILLAKLHDPPPCGERMPQDAAPLSARDLACVRAWIEDAVSTCETCGTETCVDRRSDADHCGSCGEACPAGIACVDGSCLCPLGAELCGDACVDTSTDPQHCGGCGDGCDPGQVCSAGGCVGTCDVGLEPCGGACVDTQTSNNHCGECGLACSPGLACVAGACQCAAEPVSFEAEVEPLLVSNCALAGCHAPPQIQLGLDLRAGKGYASLVGVASSQCGTTPRVDPGSPGTSYLLAKLRGVELCGGLAMPLNAEPLAQAEIQRISDWICQGALAD